LTDMKIVFRKDNDGLLKEVRSFDYYKERSSGKLTFDAQIIELIEKESNKAMGYGWIDVTDENLSSIFEFLLGEKKYKYLREVNDIAEEVEEHVNTIENVESDLCDISNSVRSIAKKLCEISKKMERKEEN